VDEQFQHVGFNGNYEMITLDDLRIRLNGLYEELATLDTPDISRELNSLERIPQQTESVKLDGQVNLGVDVHVTDDKTTARAYVKRNTVPPWLNTGNVFDARGLE
jgi:hypothetical protein